MVSYRLNISFSTTCRKTIFLWKRTKRGFHKTTMKDIIEQSELSSGAIYIYFKSKTDIINAIADMRHQKETELFKEGFSKNSIRDSLEYLVDQFIGDLINIEARQDRRIGIQMWAEALHSPDILPTVKKGIDEPLKFLSHIIKQAQSNGEISKSLSPEDTARAMIALFQGFLLQIAWDETVNIIEFKKTILETMNLMLKNDATN